jgi:hypothetical protein
MLAKGAKPSWKSVNPHSRDDNPGGDRLTDNEVIGSGEWTDQRGKTTLVTGGAREVGGYRRRVYFSDLACRELYHRNCTCH